MEITDILNDPETKEKLKIVRLLIEQGVPPSMLGEDPELILAYLESYGPDESIRREEMKPFLQESTGDLRIRAGLLWLLDLHGEEDIRIPRNLLKEKQDILEGKEEEVDIPEEYDPFIVDRNKN